jgi:hypothetical protein
MTAAGASAGAKRTLRPLILLPVALVAWIAIGIFVEAKLGWPARYGVHCPPRYCLPDELWGSGALLRRRDPLELFLFTWLWSLAVLFLFSLVLPVVRKIDGAAK